MKRGEGKVTLREWGWQPTAVEGVPVRSSEERGRGYPGAEESPENPETRLAITRITGRGLVRD